MEKLLNFKTLEIMKACELKKTSEALENIYKLISEANSRSEFKCFIPHFVYVSEKIRLQLIEDGFKVYRGDWDGVITNCLIIEW
ncbi:hypothetical protein ACFS5M_14025 [Lacinutrix iliipiscaria]|uniref:Uncharacterized protein n=1 Tax=Lacinutrix iliipiscaria TaxID=1230532 RepID=A0ABW5WTN4_9FLAO